MSEESPSLDTAAAAIHEMFLSYMRAGFMRSEALALVKIHLAAVVPGGEAHDDG